MNAVVPNTIDRSPTKVKMVGSPAEDVATPSIIMDNFAKALRRQNVRLPVSLWRQILAYFDSRSSSERSVAVGIEVLATYGNVSANEVFEEWVRDMPMEEAEKAARRSLEMERMLRLALLDLTRTDRFVEQQKISDAVKRFLSRGSLLKAIQDAINLDFKPVDAYVIRNVESVKETLKRMKIYTCRKAGLVKGCVLRDSILIAEGNLAGIDDKDPRYHADLCSLAVHEACHFVLRSVYDDYTVFSSTSFADQVRNDPKIAGKPLELGRAAELRLVGGIEVDWAASNEEATVEFLRRVDKWNKIPLFQEHEFQKYGLIEGACFSSAGAKFVRPFPKIA